VGFLLEHDGGRTPRSRLEPRERMGRPSCRGREKSMSTMVCRRHSGKRNKKERQKSSVYASDDEQTLIFGGRREYSTHLEEKTTISIDTKGSTDPFQPSLRKEQKNNKREMEKKKKRNRADGSASTR